MKLKIFVSILILMTMCSLLNITNFKSMAATTANIVVDTKNVVQGNEVEVNISLQNNVEFSAANFVLSYDASKIEYKGYTVGNTLKRTDGSINGTILLNEKTSGIIKIGYISDATETSEIKSAGQLLKLKFSVNSGAGTSLKIELEATTLKKEDGTDVATNIKNGNLCIISGLKMTNSSLNLEIGESSTLSVSTLPTTIDISKETITWKSKNTSVATVNSNGVVTAVATGSTIITATVLGLTAECAVTVEKETIPLNSISLNKTEIELDVGENETLQIIYNPTNTTDSKNVIWSSSNQYVATVDTNGKITAVSAGTTLITATVANKTATCTVSVLTPLSISLDITNLTLPVQQIKQLTVIYNREVKNKDVKWSSSNEDIVKVNQNGLVTALKEGKATITALVEGKTTTCNVTVSGKLGDIDQDDKITAYDAYRTLEVSVDISLGKNIKNINILTLDVDKDKEVTAQDAYNILEYSVGLINKF